MYKQYTVTITRDPNMTDRRFNKEVENFLRFFDITIEAIPLDIKIEEVKE